MGFQNHTSKVFTESSYEQYIKKARPYVQVLRNTNPQWSGFDIKRLEKIDKDFKF